MPPPCLTRRPAPQLCPSPALAATLTSPIVTARATRPRHAAAAAAFSPPHLTHPPHLTRRRQMGLGGDRTIHGGGALTLTLTLTLTLDLTLTLARTLA